MRLALRVKTYVTEHCQQFEFEPFLAEDEWKATREFEGILRETSRLTTVCQNKDKLNSACVPVTRKIYMIVCQETL